MQFAYFAFGQEPPWIPYLCENSLWEAEKENLLKEQMTFRFSLLWTFMHCRILQVTN